MPVTPRASLLRAAAVLALVGLAGCAGGSPSTVPTGGSPAASTPAGGVQTVQIEMTDAGCPPVPATATAGPITFQITNKDSGKASEAELVQGERVLAEKENLTPGLSGSFSLDVAPGDYEIYCPGATTERSPFTVTAASPAPSGAGTSPSTDAALAAALEAATVGYATYVRQEVAALVSATARFAAAVEAGDIEAAKALYGPARIPYERIEPVAESFGDIDPAIDIRIADVEDPLSWTGFHRIEKALWTDRSLDGMTTIARQLVADIARLEGLVETAEYQPAQLANGASELLDEVAMSKVTGEEEAVRLAMPATPAGERILRRGYSYTDGIHPQTGLLDAGLFFIAYQKDPRTGFVPIQRRLAGLDSLNEYIRHTGSAVFACPPGLGADGWWGETLLG